MQQHGPAQCNMPLLKMSPIKHGAETRCVQDYMYKLHSRYPGQARRLPQPQAAAMGQHQRETSCPHTKHARHM